MPGELPCYDGEELNRMKALDYPQLAAKVMAFFFPGIGGAKAAAGLQAKAYAPEKFGGECPVRLHGVDGDTVMLELWHGPQSPFRPPALQTPPPPAVALPGGGGGRSPRPRPRAPPRAIPARRRSRALPTCPARRWPSSIRPDGVSEMQRLQMVTHRAQNVAVFAVDGNFDDDADRRQAIFADAALREEAASKGVFLSSANSINVGRLIPQIVYYIYAYLQSPSNAASPPASAIDIAVPTGNFGNILAAWLAGEWVFP